MNKALAIIFGTAMLALAASCSSDDVLQQEPNVVPTEKEYAGDVIISADDFVFEASTRTSFNDNGNTAEFLWAENDTVGIFPDKGTQVEFPMTEGAGTNSAAFDGGGWGLKSANTYYAYYPFQRKLYLAEDAKTQIPVSYAGQKQNGNGSLAHLGAYDFMAAKGVKPENGGLNFQFAHLGCLMKITIKLEGGPLYLKNLTLETTDEDFTIDGTVDITADSPSITPKTKSKTFTIDVSDVPRVPANEDIDIYFMMPPVDLTGKTLSMTLTASWCSVMKASLTPKNFQAGHAYAYNLTFDAFNGHEYVDLGLPSGLKWATCNIGAQFPSEYGSYFEWSKTTPANAFYYNPNNDDESYSIEDFRNWGYIDSKNNLTPEHDPAIKHWGGNWRMPTIDEINELINCTWTWSSLDGQNGSTVTGPNGNSIFIPASGWRDNELNYAGTAGYLWSATCYSDPKYAQYLHFNNTGADANGRFRFYGMPIRPVAK